MHGVNILIAGYFVSTVGKYYLLYFPIRGRGEPIRFLFWDNGIEFEEQNVYDGEGNDWRREWKSKMIFGQLPFLRDNELELVQSCAIQRHLARKHDLYGQSLQEAALIDVINDGTEDLRTKYYTLIYKNYENGKDAYIAALPSQLKPFETLLAKNGADVSGCCVGSKKSFTDYNLTDLLDLHLILAPGCLKDFPVLAAFYQINMNRPGIVKYHQTTGYKERMVNGNNKQ